MSPKNDRLLGRLAILAGLVLLAWIALRPPETTTIIRTREVGTRVVTPAAETTTTAPTTTLGPPAPETTPPPAAETTAPPAPEPAPVVEPVAVTEAPAPSPAPAPTAAPVPCARWAAPPDGTGWIAWAEQLGLGLSVLLEANGATVDTPLLAGVKLCIPAGGKAPQAPATTAVPAPAAPTTQAPATTAAPRRPTTPATTAPPTTQPRTGQDAPTTSRPRTPPVDFGGWPASTTTAPPASCGAC